MDIQTQYQTAIKFAAEKHRYQKVPGSDLPYVVHLSNVAMEILMAAYQTIGFNAALAVQVALLHDTMEDTGTAFGELKSLFGNDIAEGVLVLTKIQTLPKEQQMGDSLNRIKKLSFEIWAVKMADRITNLQPPPHHWDKIKIMNYLNEAQLIYNELKDGNRYLVDRLNSKISDYKAFL